MAGYVFGAHDLHTVHAALGLKILLSCQVIQNSQRFVTAHTPEHTAAARKALQQPGPGLRGLVIVADQCQSAKPACLTQGFPKPQRPFSGVQQLVAGGAPLHKRPDRIEKYRRRVTVPSRG